MMIDGTKDIIFTRLTDTNQIESVSEISFSL